MSELKPNSFRSREETAVPAPSAEVKPVVSEAAKVRKKNEIERLTDILFAKDLTSVKTYLFNDIIKPELKKLAFSVFQMIGKSISDSGHMLIFGEPSRNQTSQASTISSYWRGNNSMPSVGGNAASVVADRGFSYEDLTYSSRQHAEAVLNEMCNILQKFNRVSISEMYELSNVAAPYTYRRYGWTDLSAADVVSVADGFIIKLPRATLIK